MDSTYIGTAGHGIAIEDFGQAGQFLLFTRHCYNRYANIKMEFKFQVI